MSEAELFQYVLAQVNITPYKMFDSAERVSIIEVAFSRAYRTYQIGAYSFLDYAMQCIYEELDASKKKYYAQIRVESPSSYEDICYMRESPFNMENHIILMDFIRILPKKLQFVATGYINKLTHEDLCEIMNTTADEIDSLNAELRKLWDMYNKE